LEAVAVVGKGSVAVFDRTANPTYLLVTALVAAVTVRSGSGPMPSLSLPQVTQPRALSAAFSVLALFGPACLLTSAALTGRGSYPTAYWAGAGATALLALGLHRFVAWQPLRTPFTGVPAAIASIAWWVGGYNQEHFFGIMVHGALVLMAIGLFGGYALLATRAPSLRRARMISMKLAARHYWPDNLDACRHVPEVKVLRDALRDEVGPAMYLLTGHPPTVRIAALAAMEFRRSWRRGQPDIVLEIAKNEPLAEIRAAALLALAGVNQRLIVEEMVSSLRDPSLIVRQAAVDALLWDCEARWIWVRHAVHEALADPRFVKDGPMNLTMGRYSEQAVSDLTAWATEAGTLGLRAAETLTNHYQQRIAESSDPKLMAELQDHVASLRSPAILRIELAQLLRKFGSFTPGMLETMLDPANPSPLRLFAVEALLQRKVDEKSIEVLRQVARQPNRELALQAAIIVQKYLHVDLGLAIGQSPPALHTRQAADVTRRVIQWAEQTPSKPPSAQAVPRPSRTAGSKPGGKALADSVLSLPPSVTGVPAPPEDKKFIPLEWD
jgi:hypothetical protein